MKRTSVLMELFYGPHLLTGKCITPKGRSNFEICCKTWFRPPTLWFGEEIWAILPRSCKVYSYIQFQGKQNNLGPAMSTSIFLFLWHMETIEKCRSKSDFQMQVQFNLDNGAYSKALQFLGFNPRYQACCSPSTSTKMCVPFYDL